MVITLYSLTSNDWSISHSYETLQLEYLLYLMRHSNSPLRNVI